MSNICMLCLFYRKNTKRQVITLPVRQSLSRPTNLIVPESFIWALLANNVQMKELGLLRAVAPETGLAKPLFLGKS